MSLAAMHQPVYVPATPPDAGNPDVCGPVPWGRRLTRVALGLLLLGVLWRTLRYLLCFPLWGDEAFVCLNLLDRDYLGLTEPCRFHQLVPLLFLWTEATAYHILGGTECALRLLPLLAGVGSLVLFWRLCRLSVGPLAGTLAVGILAVSYYPLRHSCEVKPYALDLLFSLALLVLAAAWLRCPQRWQPLAGLALLAPVAVLGSYPAVFVAGGVSVAMLPGVWRRRDKSTWTWYVLYNVLVAATFLGAFWLLARRQFDNYGAGSAYWTASFPPARPWPLLQWLVTIHAGNLLAYPLGGKDGASAGTLILCLVGLWRLGRGGRGDLLLLYLAPFGLTLAAAALHRYPYGGSARIAQHLAPAICLLAGVGLAAVLDAVPRSGPARRRLVAGVCGVLALVAVLGMARDLRHPYKTEGDRRVREIVDQIGAQGSAADQVIVLDGPEAAGPTFEWYLRRQGRVAWNGQVDWPRLHTATRQLWCLGFSNDAAAADRMVKGLEHTGRRFVLADHAQYRLALGWEWCAETTEHCEVFHWVAASDGATALSQCPE
jgi:hypothetical protein